MVVSFENRTVWYAMIEVRLKVTFRAYMTISAVDTELALRF
jgi:hypothetical protein